MSQVNLRHVCAWLLALSFFAYQFVMRLFPGLVMTPIMTQFKLNATDFGFLSSMYYFGYAGMQIPMAFLLDRFGPRCMIALFAGICSVATLVFVYSDNWHVLLTARFFIGVGSAVGFLGTSKVLSLYFPRHLYGRMVGLTFTFGLPGALYGGKPTSVLVDNYGWQTSGALIGAIGFGIALLAFLLIPKDMSKKEEQHVSVWGDLKTIITTPRLVWMALANLLMVGALEGFADVWGVTYFMKTHGLSQWAAASVTSCLFVGMLFGGPLLAGVSDRFKAYYEVTFSAGLLMSLIFLAMLFSGDLLSFYTLCALMFMTGVLCCYQVLVFTAGAALAPLAMTGVVVAFLNSINMLGGSFFHTLIGTLLDRAWSGGMLDGVRSYSAVDYAWALMAIPIASLIGATLFLGTKPK